MNLGIDIGAQGALALLDESGAYPPTTARMCARDGASHNRQIKSTNKLRKIQ
jgi:hypothetical protein